MSRDLPPEAYTRETLQEAFNWLQNQPEALRGHVHTPERLVSLYQKSQRLNDQDAPVSSKKFITDLKNLATSLDQFSADPIPASGDSSQPPILEDKPPSPPRAAAPSSITSTPSTPSGPQKMDLDPLSLERLQKVQRRFNLSTDQEALRLLVSLGYEKFSEFD